METYSIGRDETCNVIIIDPTSMVSRQHATLLVDGRKMTITDHSTNGTYINGMRIAPNAPVPVTRKDVVSFAQAADLDWSSIPTKSGKYGIIAIVIAAIIVLGGGVYFYRSHKANQEELVQLEGDTTSKMTAEIERLEADIKALSDSYKKAADSLIVIQKKCDAKADSKKLRSVITTCHDAEVLLKNIDIDEFQDKVARLKENLADKVKDTQNRIESLSKKVTEGKESVKKAGLLLSEADEQIKTLADKSAAKGKADKGSAKQDSSQTVMSPNPIIY